MTYVKLVKELKKMRKQYTEKDYEYVVLGNSISAISENQTLIDMMDACYEQLAKYTDWIPVTAGLPKEGGRYLVTIEKYDGGRVIDVSSYYDNGMCFYWGIETAPVYRVLAWMPLPEMWEG